MTSRKSTPRNWVRIDREISDNPKVVLAGDAAGWMLVTAICYAAKHLTDGFIPSGMVARLTQDPDPAATARRMAEVGLWEPVEGGWMITNYLEWQASRAEVEALAETRSEMGRRAAEARWHAHAEPHAEPHALCMPEKEIEIDREKEKEKDGNVRIPTTKLPTNSRKHSSLIGSDEGVRSTAAEDHFFAEFWTRWPRKVGKAEAVKAWTKAIKRTDPQTILHGLDRLMPALTATHQRDPQYVPHPATWLNAERWNDEAPMTTTPATAKQREAEKVRAILLAMSSDSGTHDAPPPSSAPPPSPDEDEVIDASWRDVF